ncbi:hypothetical protein ASD8599_01574 [Ascidiaceihabitans donghaensis]|uniref:Teneurin-like YD-shell domain-containing protein n=1 Tax=Ascidiaceihabitans donghaensis TaxID=1510460 RepID=A0A2R8BCV1_9RHOB|nr:RHS repeat-associated core domain-containing protein [Ascidiaceihabitans donghaensis]SPH20833.1 hypothetical protein ASD8599_01574 [Ascidiaceihabitans donghaensis]
MSGENRPPSVALGVNASGYVYGADGTRLKKLEQIGTQPQSTTLYVGGVEIRDPGMYEVVLAYPHENVRLKFANDNRPPEVSYLFRDHLNSVRMIADESQAIEERSTYKPFGEENESVLAASKAQETIGWIGERHDAGAGLQYLNARYYDPELGLFTQPDWFEVTMAGVGTNRYSYSANDPVNFMDPGGNERYDGSLNPEQEEEGKADAEHERQDLDSRHAELTSVEAKMMKGKELNNREKFARRHVARRFYVEPKDVTIEQIRTTISDNRKAREILGDYCYGALFSHASRSSLPSKAKSFVNPNQKEDVVYFNDSYFGKKAANGKIIGHEISHLAFGSSDVMTGQLKPRTGSRKIDGVFYSEFYGRLGINKANKHGTTVNDHPNSAVGGC